MKTVLSIDWDYWFRDCPEMDWGHKESGLFIDIIWPMRASDIFRRGQTLEDYDLEGEGWDDLPSLLEVNGWTIDDDLEIHLAESHGSAYHAIRETKTDDGLIELINVDAHHDVKYHLDPEQDVQCDNWILALAREGRLSRVVQIYPEWRKDDPDADHLADEVRAELAELGVEYEVVFGLAEVESYHVHSVFFCRSGAWVPPWLDDEFLTAAFSWLRMTGTCRLWTRDSLESFRRPFDMEAAKKDAEATAAILAELNADKPV